MRKLPKKWKRMIAIALVAVLVGGSISWPRLSRVVFAADTEEILYRFYLEDEKGDILPVDEVLGITVEVSGGDADVIAETPTVSSSDGIIPPDNPSESGNDASGGDTSGNDISSNDTSGSDASGNDISAAALFMLRSGGESDSLTYIDVRIDWSRTEEESIELVLRCEGYQDCSVELTKSSPTVQQIMMSRTYAEIEIEADKEEPIEAEPGEQILFTVKAKDGSTVLEKEYIHWYICGTDGSKTEAAANMISEDGTILTYTAAETIEASESVTVKAEYGTEENAASARISLKPNPPIDLTDLKKNEDKGIYYVGSDYELWPEGYEKYQIGEGSKADLPLTEGLTEQAQSVKFFRSNGAVSQTYQIALDEKAPLLTETDITVSPAEGETDRRTIKASIPEDEGIGGVTLEYQIVEGGAWVSYTEEIVLSETTPTAEYKFVATDALGNSNISNPVTVNVPGVDATIPEIRLAKCNGQELSDGQTLYLNTDAVIELTAADDSSVYTSGLDTVKILYMDNEGIQKEITGSLGENGAGTVSIDYEVLKEQASGYSYALQVSDKAGNTSEALQFTIVADNIEPDVEVQWQNDGTVVPDESWLNREDVKDNNMCLYISAADNVSGIAEDGNGDKYATVTGGHLQAAEKVTLSIQQDGTYAGMLELPTSSDLNDVYQITVKDRAGNEKAENVRVKLDVTAPEVSCVEQEALVWEDSGSMTLQPTVTDDGFSGGATLYYDIYKKGEEEGNVVFTGNINLTDNESPEIPISEDGNWTAVLYVKDGAGNQSSETRVNCKIDSRKPVSDRCYAEYKEAEPVTIGEKLANLFGREKIEVTLYLQDSSAGNYVTRPVDYSDIESVKLQYDNKVITAEPEEGQVALWNNNGTYEEDTNISQAEIGDVFRVIRFTIQDSFTQTPETQIASKLKVLEITDAAGNSWQGSVEPVMLDGTAVNWLIIDGVAPVLRTMDYQNGQCVDGTYYYDDAVEIAAAIKERYFNEGNQPQVILETNGLEEVKTDLVWEASAEESYVQEAVVRLDAVSGQETEYRLRIDYADGAGNKLCPESGADVVEEGVFTSAKMVVDTKAPILHSLTVEASDGSGLLLKEGQYYVNHQSGEDLRVSFLLEDAYFNAENLHLTIWKNGEALSENRIPEIMTVPQDGTDYVEGSFTFDGEEGVTGNYTFSLSYADNAGNLAVQGSGVFEGAAQGSMQDGIYTSSVPVVISNHAPVLAEAEIRGAAVEGSMLLTEAVNGRYYAKAADGEDAVCTFTLEDAYLDIQEVTLSCYQNGSQRIFEADEIIWSAPEELENGCIRRRAQVAVDGEENSETEYLFAVSYTNRNGQKLEVMSGYVPTGAAQGAVLPDSDTYRTAAAVVVDNRTPELVDFAVTDEAGQPIAGFDGNSTYFHESTGSGQRVRIAFVLDDNEQYFASYRVTAEVISSAGEVTVPQVDYTADGRYQRGSFWIDIADGSAEDYHVRLTYADQSGRKMILSQNALFAQQGVTAGVLQNGCYTMNNNIAVDKTKPVLENVSFNAPWQYAENLVTQSGIQSGNTRLYYNSTAEVSFRISERYLYTEDIRVTLYRKGAHDEIRAAQTVPAEVIYSGGQAYFEIRAEEDHSADGEYYFTIEYADRSGNRMIEGADECDAFYPGALQGGVYTSPIIVIDTLAPQIEVSYQGTVQDSLGNIDFYNSPYSAVVTVRETNFRAKELTDWVNAGGSGRYGITLREWRFDENGNKSYKPLEEITGARNIGSFQPDVRNDDCYTLTIPIQQEDNYELGVTYIDMAGNAAAAVPVKQTAYDATRPEVEVSYQVEDAGFLDFIRYGDWGYFFAQKKITVTANVKDEVAGVRNFVHSVYENRQGEQVLTRQQDDNTDAQAYTYTFTQTMPLTQSEQDFDGMLYTEVYDWSENSSRLTRNHLVESQGTNQGSSAVSIAINTAPSRVVDGVKYYNASAGSVSFSVNASENYSGLRNVRVSPRVGTFDMGTNAMPGVDARQEMNGTYTWNVRNAVNDIEGTADSGAGQPTGALTEDQSSWETARENIVKSFSHSGSFQAGGSNDLNSISLEVSAISNTGYQQGAVSEPFTIDVTVPEVVVTYNDIPVYNDNYYKDVRVATVTFTERNFQAADIQWDITNTEGAMPVISGFSNDNSGDGSGNDTQHTGTVSFEEDGDYTFAFTFTDKAGNTVHYETEPFTIDRTLPEIEVSFDNNQSTNDYYYSEARTATVRIKEHNFNAADVEVTIAASHDGETIQSPAVGTFQDNGDEHYATISFDYDADITLDVAYTDKAGNEASAVQQQHFVVDLSDPEIVISGVESFSANKDVTAPVIELTDVNFDSSHFDISLTGYRNGPVEYAVSESSIPNGRKIVFSDFEHSENVDDMYTLKAEITDKAGRTVEQEIVFSVNRFGSSYQFDEATKALLDSYYVKEEQNLVITETNVDTLEFKDIYLMKNGEKVSLNEGTDYTVEQSGSEVSWKQYTYTLDKNNFADEGVYNVIIYSEDRAENESDNRVKNHNIEFVMDKTAPMIAVSGVEENKQYAVDERLVTLNVKDNMELDNVEVYLNGNSAPLAEYTAEQMQEAGGVVSVMLGSSNDRQVLQITASDKAGNRSQTSVENFLITSNMLVQFYRNTPVFIGSILGVVTMAAGGGYLILFRRRPGK